MDAEEIKRYITKYMGKPDHTSSGTLFGKNRNICRLLFKWIYFHNGIIS